MGLKKKFKKQTRIHSINALGALMLLLIPLIAPLPGPGGVPLLLGGLKLLSINNPWADKLYAYFKHRGLSLSDIMFPRNLKIELLMLKIRLNCQDVAKYC